MKVTVQAKVAELERRIADLEQRAPRTNARTTGTKTVVTPAPPHTIDGLWAHIQKTLKSIEQVFR